MPINKAAYTRYQIIDQILRRRNTPINLADLLEEVNDYLINNYSKESAIAFRTLQEDIRVMRQPKPDGFNAPIENIRGTGTYKYSDPGYSIHQLELNSTDKKRLREAMSLLGQIDGFPHKESIKDILVRLKILDSTSFSGNQFIHYEESYYSRGLEWIEPIYEAITKKQSQRIKYVPFNQDPVTMTIFPYFLKEFRDRWYIYGWSSEDQKVYNLALDRIAEVSKSIKKFEDHADSLLFKDLKSIVGVTLPEKRDKIKVKVKVLNDSLPYLLTKPLHSSQRLISKSKHYGILQYNLYPNFEFEAEIMRLANFIEVVEPGSLRKSIYHKLKTAIAHYK